MSAPFTIMLAVGAILGSSAIAQTPPPSTKSDAPPAATQIAPSPAAVPASAPPTPAVSAQANGRDHAMDGLAAYYSKRLNGRKTASGNIFNQNALTAAHPTLPFGTRIKVTNTKNGRSVVVRINDRGPTQPGRVVDLSRAAANKLAIRRAGLAPVKLEVVSEAPARRTRSPKRLHAG